MRRLVIPMLDYHPTLQLTLTLITGTKHRCVILFVPLASDCTHHALSSPLVRMSYSICIPGWDRLKHFATTKSGSKLLNWWSPVQNGKIVLGSYKNIRIKYKYKLVNKKPQFVSVSNYDSYLTGINLEVDWLHKGGKASFSKKNSTKGTANITVDGVYVLGVIIAVHPIGFKWNGSWKRSLTIKK